MATKIKSCFQPLRGLWESFRIRGLWPQNANHPPDVKPISFNFRKLVESPHSFRASPFESSPKLSFKPLHVVNHPCYQRSSLIVNPYLIHDFARGNRNALGFGRNFSSFPHVTAKSGGVLAQLCIKPFPAAISKNGLSWPKSNEIEEKVNLPEAKVQGRKLKTKKKRTASQSPMKETVNVLPDLMASKVDNSDNSNSNNVNKNHDDNNTISKKNSNGSAQVYMSLMLGPALPREKQIVPRVKQLDSSLIQSACELATIGHNHLMAIISILTKLLQHETFNVRVLDSEIRIFFGMEIEKVIQLLRNLGIDPESPHFTLASETICSSPLEPAVEPDNTVILLKPTNSDKHIGLENAVISEPIDSNKHAVEHLPTITEANEFLPKRTSFPGPLNLPFALPPKKNIGTDSRPCTESRSFSSQSLPKFEGHDEDTHEIHNLLGQIKNRPTTNFKSSRQREIKYRKY